MGKTIVVAQECELRMQETRADAAGFLFSALVEGCAVYRLQLYLGDSLRKSNWCYRLKMPLEECDQRAPRLRAGYAYSAAAIGSWPPEEHGALVCCERRRERIARMRKQGGIKVW